VSDLAFRVTVFSVKKAVK